MRALIVAATVLAACGYPSLAKLSDGGGVADDATVDADGSNGINPDASTTGPPTGLTYTSNFALYTEQIPIAPNMPSASGSPITSYAVSPALPTGLAMDTTSGVITGTPGVESTLAPYTVTATNPEGDTTVMVSIAVNSRGAVDAGDGHACARVSGGIKCWGNDLSGELGNNMTSLGSSVPVAVSGISTGVLQVTAGDHHSCALFGNGVQCWGANNGGQLGNISTTNSSVPVAVSGLTSGVLAISAGVSETCAIVNGGAKCWGKNNVGQLGNNSTQDSDLPASVTGLTAGVQAISVGDNFACALTTAGSVQCWGYNNYGQLGNNSTTTSVVPVQVTGLTSGVAAISAGDISACALLATGDVRCWGFNDYGGLGNNTTTGSSVPVSVMGLTGKAQMVATGAQFACALVSGGVQCWGTNSAGQLGNGTTTNSLVAVASQLTSGVQELTVGYSTACAIVNGGLKCWGYNGVGELGNNSMTDSSSPVPVSGLSSGVQP